MLARRLVADRSTMGVAVTVIAACIDVDAGRVHMAADSLAVEANGTTMEVCKLWSPADGLLLGLAGMTKGMAIVRRHVRLEPPVDGDDIDEWVQDFAEAATRELCARGCTEDGADLDFYGSILLAWRGHLWEVQSQVANRVTRNYHAIGSGDAVALGAMWALDGFAQVPVDRIPHLAVEAAVEHLVDIGGPIDTAST